MYLVDHLVEAGAERGVEVVHPGGHLQEGDDHVKASQGVSTWSLAEVSLVASTSGSLATRTVWRREAWLSTTGEREACREAREGCRGEAREVRLARPGGGG